MITATRIVKTINLYDKFAIKDTRNYRNFSTRAIFFAGLACDLNLALYP